MTTKVSDQLAAWTAAAADVRPARAARFDRPDLPGLRRSRRSLGSGDGNAAGCRRSPCWSSRRQRRSSSRCRWTRADLPAALGHAAAGHDRRGPGHHDGRAGPRHGPGPGVATRRAWKGSGPSVPLGWESLDAMWAVANRAVTDSAREPPVPRFANLPPPRNVGAGARGRGYGDRVHARGSRPWILRVNHSPALRGAELELVTALGEAAARDYACASWLITLTASRVASRAVADADVAWQRGQAEGIGRILGGCGAG